MEFSVVVPTLNERDRLATTLDAVDAHAGADEVVVVNGPSADGTTGMVRDREDVDVLVEISDRTLNVARNAGIDVAEGDVVALVGQDNHIEAGWGAAVREAFDGSDGDGDDGHEADIDVLTGPVRRRLRRGVTTEHREERDIADRHVVYINGGNVAFDADVLADLDGFDEYLETGGSRDAAHRLAGLGATVEWTSEMAAQREYEPETDGGRAGRDWRWKYRALAYRLVKNYGIRPTVIRRTLAHAAADGAGALRDVLRGDATPTAWVGNGRDVLAGMATGASDGLVARARDRTPTRNPHGVSKRTDREVARYDRR